MHDPRAIRRRRAVLAALVALSLFLLTAYFGESASGGLHAIQRGALEVLGPIEEGANRALKPFRDLFGWIGDSVDAKNERDSSRRSPPACSGPPGGGSHPTTGGGREAPGPRGEAATRALRPFRDLLGWIGGGFDPKSGRDSSRRSATACSRRTRACRPSARRTPSCGA